MQLQTNRKVKSEKIFNLNFCGKKLGFQSGGKLCVKTNGVRCADEEFIRARRNPSYLHVAQWPEAWDASMKLSRSCRTMWFSLCVFTLNISSLCSADYQTLCYETSAGIPNSENKKQFRIGFLPPHHMKMYESLAYWFLQGETFVSREFRGMLHEIEILLRKKTSS